jgi:RNA polymerase subunit RPABC4/transcription elongation factor Spt4
MSRFTQELRVVPRTAWIIGILLYLVMATPLFVFVVRNDPELGKWPLWGQLLFAYGMFFFVVPVIAFYGYVYGDAKRRGMRYVMWTLLAIFVPYLIGVIVYFLLRDPLPKRCPRCGIMVKAGFVFCPHCGASLQPSCPNCGHAVQLDWANCPQCGQKLPSQPLPSNPTRAA